jgi:hypothetical protein
MARPSNREGAEEPPLPPESAHRRLLRLEKPVKGKAAERWALRAHS